MEIECFQKQKWKLRDTETKRERNVYRTRECWSCGALWRSREAETPAVLGSVMCHGGAERSRPK